MYNLKFDRFENADPQTLLEIGFSSVWVRMWHFKYDPSENVDPHTLQANRFPPV